MTSGTSSFCQDGQNGGISAPETVPEGGTLVVQVRSGVKEVALLVPGVGLVRVPVHNGLVEYPVPPQATGGSSILVSDEAYPDPSGASVLITGAF